MKRIVITCGMLLLVASTAVAYTPNTGATYRYSQPSRTTYTYNTARPATAAQPARTTATYNTNTVQPARVTANYPTTSQPARTVTTSYSTATAQGVANIMASTGRVGHWGGNRGYEGCGAGASPQAAYNNCCYANSGMATVDVGYARGASGMWFCCRRYR
jgi:hypothetical protein